MDHSNLGNGLKKLQESILQSIIVLLILVIATIVPYLVSSALKEHQIDKELSSQLTRGRYPNKVVRSSSKSQYSNEKC